VNQDAPVAPPVRYLELKAALLLALLLALVGGAALYLMYARGLFESTQRLVLLVDDSEGVRVGMDLTFSGFPIRRDSGSSMPCTVPSEALPAAMAAATGCWAAGRRAMSSAASLRARR
jgi:hypothetical protein